MNFKKDKYTVIRKAISKDLSLFVYNYFLMKRQVAKTLFETKLGTDISLKAEALLSNIKIVSASSATALKSVWSVIIPDPTVPTSWATPKNIINVVSPEAGALAKTICVPPFVIV